MAAVQSRGQRWPYKQSVTRHHCDTGAPLGGPPVQDASKQWSCPSEIFLSIFHIPAPRTAGTAVSRLARLRQIIEIINQHAQPPMIAPVENEH